MNTYKNYAVAIKVLSILMIVCTVILTISNWFYPSIYSVISDSLPKYDVSTFTFVQKISGFIIESISSAIFIFSLVLIVQLMNYIQNNEYFSQNTILLLKKISKLALIYAIYKPISSTILSVITTINNKPGERIISLTIGSDEIWNIMIFCFMFIIVTILQRGYEIKHEQELTI